MVAELRWVSRGWVLGRECRGRPAFSSSEWKNQKAESLGLGALGRWWNSGRERRVSGNCFTVQEAALINHFLYNLMTCYKFLKNLVLTLEHKREIEPWLTTVSPALGCSLTIDEHCSAMEWDRNPHWSRLPFIPPLFLDIFPSVTLDMHTLLYVIRGLHIYKRTAWKMLWLQPVAAFRRIRNPQAKGDSNRSTARNKGGGYIKSKLICNFKIYCCNDLEKKKLQIVVFLKIFLIWVS